MEAVARTAKVQSIREVLSLGSLPKTINQEQSHNKSEIDLRAIVDELPYRYSTYDFEGMIINEDNKKFVNYCKQYLEGSTSKKSIVFYGTVGAGKTRLAISTMKNMPPRVRRAVVKYYEKLVPTKSCFIQADMLFDRLNQSLDIEGKEKYFKKLFSNYDIILVDDLCFDNFSAAKKDNLYLLVNCAYLWGKTIFITMNFPIEKLKEVDPRIYDRIIEMAVVMNFKGESFRK